MTGKILLEKLLETCQSTYDIERTCDINGDIYDAYAGFHAAGARYVLVKKAELWRANCFEHIFFRIKQEQLDREDLDTFRSQIVEYMEPRLVRGGKRWPEANHMYTYLTVMYLCEQGADEEAKKAVRSFRYEKNYLFTVRGYCQARVVAFDLKNQEIFGNRAAKDVVKGYKKSGIF